MAGFYPLRPRHRVTWVKTKREGVKSGCSGTLEPDRLGLSCNVNKCSDTGTGDLGVLPFYETLSRHIDPHSLPPLLMANYTDLVKVQSSPLQFIDLPNGPESIDQRLKVA